MTAQDLKNSILQLAMQGKLVEQRAEEGTARELIKNSKFCGKGQKIEDDEKPYDIPNSWCWVRLVDIGDIVGGGTPKTSEVSFWENGDIPWMTPADMCGLGKYVSCGERKITQAGLKNSSARLMPKGTVIYSSRAPIGYVGIALNELCTNQGFKSLVPFNIELSEYLYYCLISRTQNIINRASGTTFKEISGNEFGQTILPMPPLEEQKRIVAKIEELLPYVDKYDKAYSKMKVFDKKFAEDMQKSILQYAMQGKLVEQRAEEGTGEELYQNIKTEKEQAIQRGKGKREKPYSKSPKYQNYPFSIPVNWKYVRFGELMINRDAERKPVSSSERQGKNKIYDYYGASGIIDQIDDYLFDEELLLIGEDGANLINRSKSIAFIARGKYWVNNHAHCLQCCNGVDINFICYYINSISLIDYVTGTAQPKMNQENMNAIWIPLPPYKEQKRIVAELEKIMPYCEKMRRKSHEIV